MEAVIDNVIKVVADRVEKTLIVIKSTIPVGYTKSLREIVG